MTRIQPSYNNTRTTISSTTTTTTTMMLIPWLFLFFISFAHSTTTNAAFVSSASASTSATVVRDDATLTQQCKQLFGRRRQTSIRNAYRSSSGPTHLYESRSTSNVDRGGGSATSSKSGYTQTKFIASMKARSDTVPSKDGNKNILKDFFLLKAHRDLLFPYEDSVVASGPLNEPFHSRANILQHEYLPPVDGKEVDNALLEFISGGISFPGIKVTSAIKMSSQTFVSNKTKLPEYRFLLLESSNKAEGPRPIVWLFNKLTGAGESNKEQTTFSCTRVYVESSSPSSNDDGNDALRFCANAHLEVRLNLPKVMMKLLPMKQDKFEEEGSKSLQGAMKDLQPSIERFQKAYLNWLEL